MLAVEDAGLFEVLAVTEHLMHLRFVYLVRSFDEAGPGRRWVGRLVIQLRKSFSTSRTFALLTTYALVFWDTSLCIRFAGYTSVETLARIKASRMCALDAVNSDTRHSGIGRMPSSVIYSSSISRGMSWSISSSKMVLGRPRIAIMYVSKVRIAQNSLFRVSLSTGFISAG
jgi:hypothetical protein